jgi:RNase P/RNase MRP subunit p29
MQYADGLFDSAHRRPSGVNSFPFLLMRADLHGAHLRVSRSSTPSRVGTEGIVIDETLHTFRLVKEDDAIVTVPKAACHFVLTPGTRAGVTATLVGSNLVARPVERGFRKFKVRHLLDPATGSSVAT